MLLFSALLLGIIARASTRSDDRYSRNWSALSIAFLFFSMDEVASIHELLTKPLQAMGASGIFYYGWVIPGMVVVLIFFIFNLKFFLQLPTRTKRLFSISAFLYIGGAIGAELLGGRHDEIYGTQNVTYAIITTIEEALEMIGLLVFIHALLQYMAENLLNISFAFEKSQHGHDHRH